MEYLSYKEAFDAVVEDNDGVLPDLYEVFDFIIYRRPVTLQGPLTVAEIVAYALLEASESEVTVLPVPALPEAMQLPYVPASTGEPLYLDKLLDQAIASIN